MSYRRRMAEAALKDFPAIKKDHDSYKLMLDARALAGGCLLDEPPGGPGGLAAGDRWVERYDDPVFRKLSALLTGIYDPFCGLPPAQRRVLVLRYWQKMEITEIAQELLFSERSIFRIVARALEDLYAPLLAVQPLLEEWRAGRLK